jgi:hypothetical protein
MMRENGAKNFGWFEWYGYMMRAGTDFLTPDFSGPRSTRRSSPRHSR